METKVEELQEGQVELTITIGADEIDKRIKATYKDFAHKYNFPGFRRGKAPRPVIDNALGAEAIRATVTEAVINDTYPLAIDESGVAPISKPTFNDEDALVEDGKPFVFSCTFSVKPELALSDYDPIAIELPCEGATDTEIELQINVLREHYYDFEAAPAATKIVEDGYADIAVAASDANGESLEEISWDSRFYGLGSGMLPAAFDQELVGMKKGQKKSFDLDITPENSAGLSAVSSKTKSVHFDVEILAVKKKVLPEANDEWAKETLGFESLEDLKTRISESIIEGKAESLPRMKENQCLSVLAARLTGDVPESMVESAETDLLQTFFQQLQKQGANLDSYLQQQGITIEQFKEDVKRQADDVTRQDLALDAWVRHKGFEVTDEDIKTEFANSGADDPEALEKEWRSHGQLSVLRQNLLRVKAVNDVIDTAIVTQVDPDEKNGITEKAKDSKTDSAKETKEAAPKKTTKKTPAKKTTATKASSASKKATEDKASDEHGETAKDSSE